jgi:hypothetical protein
VSRETILSLAERDWIEPAPRENASRSDWKLTETGKEAFRRYRGDYQQIIDRHIDWEIERHQPKSSTKQSDYRIVEVALADSKGVWVRRVFDLMIEDIL